MQIVQTLDSQRHMPKRRPVYFALPVAGDSCVWRLDTVDLSFNEGETDTNVLPIWWARFSAILSSRAPFFSLLSVLIPKHGPVRGNAL